MNKHSFFSYSSRKALSVCKLILINTAFLSTASFAQEQTSVDISITSILLSTPSTVTLGSGQAIQFPVFVFLSPSDRSVNDIVLTVDIPEGVTFSSIKTDRGACSYADNRVTCNMNYIASGWRLIDWYAEIQIYVKPTRRGTVTLTARITSNESDPNLSNNTTTKTFTVVKSRGQRVKIL